MTTGKRYFLFQTSIRVAFETLW